MCGLVGMIARKPLGFGFKDKNIFEQLLFTDTIRGVDSTGIFGVNAHGNVIAHKTATAAPAALQTTTFKEFINSIYMSQKMVFGHNRASTRGATVDENAHPFVEGNICLMHNGTLHTHKELANTDVDSHAICHSLNERGYRETFEKVDGAFALIWYDAETKRLHMARNKERPLHMAVSQDAFYFASELKMLDWVLSRNDVKDYKIYYLAEDETYTWELENPKDYKTNSTPKKKHYTKSHTTYPVTTMVNRKPYGKKHMDTTTITNDDEGIEYQIGSVIEFYNDGTKESKRKHVNIVGNTIDGAHTNVVCQIPSNLTDDQRDALLDTDFIMATVSMIYMHQGVQTLLVRDPFIMDETVTSKNDVTITKAQYEEHGGDCTYCFHVVPYSSSAKDYSITDAIVTVRHDKIETITCKACADEQKHWGLNIMEGNRYYD